MTNEQFVVDKLKEFREFALANPDIVIEDPAHLDHAALINNAQFREYVGEFATAAHLILRDIAKRPGSIADVSALIRGTLASLFDEGFVIGVRVQRALDKYHEELAAKFEEPEPPVEVPTETETETGTVSPGVSLELAREITEVLVVTAEEAQRILQRWMSGR